MYDKCKWCMHDIKTLNMARAGSSFSRSVCLYAYGFSSGRIMRSNSMWMRDYTTVVLPLLYLKWLAFYLTDKHNARIRVLMTVLLYADKDYYARSRTSSFDKDEIKFSWQTCIFTHCILVLHSRVQNVTHWSECSVTVTQLLTKWIVKLKKIFGCERLEIWTV